MKPKRADAYFVCQHKLAEVVKEAERILLMEDLPDPSPEKDMLDMAVSNLQQAQSDMIKARLRMHE
tara:strand:- start:278 stop:475 length:198 start_codon:yes stop_codon:yes gene_type:complete